MIEWRRKRSVIIVVGIILFTSLLILLIRWLNEPFAQCSYGIKQLSLTNGQILYLKKEAGPFFNERLSLSTNGERCKGPDDNRDYIFSSLGASDSPIYFIPGNGEITVFELLTPPKQLKWSINVKQESRDEVRYLELEKNISGEEVFKISIEPSEMTICQ